MIAEFLVVDEVPLPASVLIAPSVTFAGEVDPFGMSELIAHEVEVAAVDGAEGGQANHLVQSDATGDGIVLVALLEVPVHVAVDETEDDGLVAHECLVVALSIGDGLLVASAVGQLPQDAARLPVFVAKLLDDFNPVVGDVHCQAVVEAVAAVLEGKCQAGHSTHLFGNGDGILVDSMNQLVGQGEISDGIAVLMSVVVVAIGHEALAEAVAVVEHGGDAVEAEAVEVELLEPVLAVGEQEVEHFVLAVVEAKAVPCGMLSAVALVEVLAGVAGKVCQAFHLILHSMAVHDVHDDSKAHAVRLVDEGFQLVGSAETGARSKEAADVVAEAAVIGMLLDGHYLNAVVAIGSHSGQDIVAELSIGADALLVLSHADVALVDEERVGSGAELLHLPLISLLGVPHLSAEDVCLFILHHSCSPCRYAFSLTAFPMHDELEEGAMAEGLVLDFQFPVAGAADASHGIAGTFLPSVEVAHHEDVDGIGSPFAQHPSVLGLVQAEVEVAAGKFIEVVCSACQLSHLASSFFVPAIDGIGIFCQGIVVADNLEDAGHRCSFFG